jgi:hypothetical protein
MNGSGVRFNLLKCRVVGVHRERRGVHVHPCVQRQSLNNCGHLDSVARSPQSEGASATGLSR